MDLNRVTLIGNLAQNPISRNLPSGLALTTFRVATNRVWKDAKTGKKKEDANFHQVLAWGKLGEICAQYLAKGRRIYVEGRLQHRTWEDKNKKKRYTTEIVAENMIMLGKPSEKEAKQNAEVSAPKEEVNLQEVPVEEEK